MYITSTKAPGFGSNTRSEEIFKDAIDVQTPYDPYILTIYSIYLYIFFQNLQKSRAHFIVEITPVIRFRQNS